MKICLATKLNIPDKMCFYTFCILKILLIIELFIKMIKCAFILSTFFKFYFFIEVFISCLLKS